MPATVTVPGDLMITFMVNKEQNYAIIENALLASGFQDYRISRTVFGNLTEVVITLSPPAVLGIPTPFPAKDTLNKLATAVGKFGD